MNPNFDRRTMLCTLAGACGLVAAAPLAIAQDKSTGRKRPDPLDRDLVNEYVSIAHSDLEKTRTLLDREPRLVRAAWDWGGGDFESGLGAAGHSGRADIAKLLLDRGAPFELCASAMLGQLEIVRAALETRPSLVSVAGPHGIPLIAHARSGGEAASSTVAYLVALERSLATPNDETGR